MAHYDIFRHHLLIKFPAYGHALWEPNPGNLYPAVEVGDVGYIRQGKFRRLFNVLLPATDPSHRNFGVPEYHEQLTLNMESHIEIGRLSPHNFCSAGVTSGHELDRHADGPREKGEVSFLCPMSQGAVLCLPIQAKGEDTVASADFGKWIVRHIDRWFAWARQRGLGINRMEDIILVTGTHRTRSCANVAFPGGQGDAQALFKASVDRRDDNVAITWQSSHERNRGAVLNFGPDGEDLPEDQCIFIRGFRVTRKLKIFPPKLKGAAGPSPDPEGYDEEPDVELVPIPSVPEYRDPLHILLEYIAEETPSCDMVLVHDDDLAEIYDSAPLYALQPDVGLSYARNLKPTLHNTRMDLSSARDSTSADTESAWVATLSNIFEKQSSSSTPSTSQSLILFIQERLRPPAIPGHVLSLLPFPPASFPELSETGEQQPSSVTSNQTRASAGLPSSHPTGHSRRSRNTPARSMLARLNSGRHVVQVTRKEPTKARTTAHHAKADKAAATKVTGSPRQQPSPVEPQQPPSTAQAQYVNRADAVAPKGVTSNSDGTRIIVGAGAGGAPRRGIVVSNISSEYETTDTEGDDDDDSWASEDFSEGAAETAGMRPTDKRPPTNEEISEAALEAQRQRELFVKQPKRSYSNLGRTQSGSLSQLLNPDPTVFPPGRPSRVSSMHDMTRPSIPSALTSGKSSAALPQAAQITAQAPMGAATSSGHSDGNIYGTGGGGYRPKGCPQDEEFEDGSDSPDDPDDTAQVSDARQRAKGQPQPSGMEVSGRPLLPTVATAPIPLNHPWNLPAPAPPTSPRTTRRQMLATELSESLRRDLLWERQVSKTNLVGNAGRRDGNVLGGGGGLPTAGVVDGNAQAGPSQQQRQGGSVGPGEGATGAAVEDSVAERRRRALARNRTWDDFQYFGW